MLDPVIKYTEEALAYFLSTGMLNYTNSVKNMIEGNKANQEFHFYFTSYSLKNSVQVASWISDGDIVLTLDEFIALQLIPTIEARQAYLSTFEVCVKDWSSQF